MRGGQELRRSTGHKLQQQPMNLVDGLGPPDAELVTSVDRVVVAETLGEPAAKVAESARPEKRTPRTSTLSHTPPCSGKRKSAPSQNSQLTRRAIRIVAERPVLKPALREPPAPASGSVLGVRPHRLRVPRGG